MDDNISESFSSLALREPTMSTSNTRDAMVNTDITHLHFNYFSPIDILNSTSEEIANNILKEFLKGPIVDENDIKESEFYMTDYIESLLLDHYGYILEAHTKYIYALISYKIERIYMKETSNLELGDWVHKCFMLMDENEKERSFMWNKLVDKTNYIISQNIWFDSVNDDKKDQIIEKCHSIIREKWLELEEKEITEFLSMLKRKLRFTFFVYYFRKARKLWEQQEKQIMKILLEYLDSVEKEIIENNQKEHN
ncbi:hypothetical protein PRELSG_0029700 [Plasmodium relictum]|uniref:Uncharacterized protein n=1 Tax=Plasmodium relictum TaxID=85471 RepID=A0A1J1GK98_PLARL|nr:hypothetical protein PRELSG_0029700 [Plasmodium relictum]CRG84904.1 hypothetical protein PRELSG_0029700 [Plasmodium relictum]